MKKKGTVAKKVTAKAGSKATIFTMALAALGKAPAAMAALVAKAYEILPGLTTLTPDQRKVSHGRLRDGQLKAIVAVFHAAHAYPEYFKSLAAKVDASSPKVYNAGPLLDLTQRIPLVIAARAALMPLMQRLDDTILDASDHLAQPAEDAYHIARAMADSDAELRTVLQDAIEFYGDIARKGVKTKAANKTKAAK